ncbi:MAG: oligosaccharide flippase family protein [Candidatus Woesearchaeota archaeon]
MKHLIKSTMYLTISNVLTKVFSLVFFIILARSLSVNDYGLFRYLLTVSLIYAIGFSGINTSLTFFVSKYRKKSSEYIFNSFFLMFFIFIILSIIILIFQEYSFYLILFLFASLVDFFYLGFSRGILNYFKLAGFKLVENIIQLIILVTFYFTFKSVDFGFAVIFYSFSGLLSLIFFEIIKNELVFSFKFSFEKIKKIIKYTIPVTLGSIGWSLMFGINVVFIKLFYNTEQVAYFSVGESIVQVFGFIPGAIGTILLPKISRLKNKNKILKPLKFAILSNIIISFFILIFLLLTNKILIHYFFTDVYLPSSVVILPLSLAQIFIAIVYIFGTVFQGLNKPLIPTITISIAAVLNVIGSYFLTKNFGIVGAATSNAITSFIAATLIIILFYREFRK